MIHGSDLPPGILALRFLDGHAQRLVRNEYSERWECSCAEYRTVKPNTARAYCEHTQRCDFTGEPVATSCRAIRGTSADPTA